MNHFPGLKEKIILKNFCTLGIGGPARYFLEIKAVAEMQEALHFCKTNHLKYMVLGKGSNTLFDDLGFNGAVLLNKIDFFEQPSRGTFHVGAGYNFSLLGIQTARKQWGGLEFASGIPGSVGGAVYMNAGANGKETCEVLESVDYVSNAGDFIVIRKQDLIFAYRSSCFQNREGAIVGATFTLEHSPDARKKQIEIVNARIKSQPYGDKSAGCIFVNPNCGSAGGLIDQCGLKGAKVGGAEVSNLHANFLINSNGATCQDMLHLISYVKGQVKNISGIELTPEVRYIPYISEDE